MQLKKKEHPKQKQQLHVRNKHRERYNFEQLIKTCPALKTYVEVNAYQDASINFFNAAAVKMLNKALLQHFYGISYWNIPDNYLCPPIPGRADYIHYVADVLGASNNNNIPTGNAIKCLDIGVGANCVYPIIGHQEYGWHFVGSDIDEVAVMAATEIVAKNAQLHNAIEIRLQKNSQHIFKGIIQQDEHYDVTICNPPFHASAQEAQIGSLRKLSNLKQQKQTKAALNFGGVSNELWCLGGEEKFVTNMIIESKQFAESVCWFTSLVSKSIHLKGFYNTLHSVNATQVKTIEMTQGNKVSRLLAWSFLSKEQQQNWANKYWK